MRKDLNKILVEDPRRGGDKFSWHRNCKLNATFDEDAVGGKESMMSARRRAKGNRKRFGDHLAPLRGLLRTKVGEKWDDVYGEICRTFNKDKVMNNHILEHTFGDFVDIHSKFDEDGDILTKGSGRWSRWYYVSTTNNQKRESFYVHPETGVLCSTYVEREAGIAKLEAERLAAKKAEYFRKHSNGEHLWNEDGVWYVFTIAKVPEAYYEYVCPSWGPFDKRAKWTTMSLAEREANGQRVLVRPDYRVVNPSRYNQWSRDSLPRTLYYARKRVASRTILKQHGLVGTNAPVGSARSQRELKKYR
jgi:hypothetical protein